MKDKSLLRKRLAIGIGVPLLFLAGALTLKFIGGPPCLFHSLTGLHCAGCGAGRCCKAILDLRFLDAFCYNPLMCVFLPFLAYVIVKYYIKAVSGRDVLPDVEIKYSSGIVILIVIVLFWVLRNIPVAPFTYLAPHPFGGA